MTPKEHCGHGTERPGRSRGSKQGGGSRLGLGGYQGRSGKNQWRVFLEWTFGVFFFFLILFSVEVFQVELTGFPDRTHSGSVLSMVQALMSGEKSRGGRSTQNDL